MTSLAGAIASANKADAIVNNDTDPQKGLIADLVRTHAEEAALLDAAIAKYGSGAKTVADRALLARARGDAASARLRWKDAIAAYDAALALEPKNVEVLESLAYASSAAKDYAGEIAADQRLATVRPNDPGPLLELALAYAKRGDYGRSLPAFDRATAAATVAPLQVQANVHSYYGRTLVKARRPDAARAEFAKVIAVSAAHAQDRRTICALHRDRSRGDHRPVRTIGCDGGFAGTVDGCRSSSEFNRFVQISARRFGKERPPNCAAHGAFAQSLIASFCTSRICAPFKTTITLPDSGVDVIEFQLIAPDEKTKPPAVPATVISGRRERSGDCHDSLGGAVVGSLHRGEVELFHREHGLHRSIAFSSHQPVVKSSTRPRGTTCQERPYVVLEPAALTRLADPLVSLAHDVVGLRLACHS